MKEPNWIVTALVGAIIGWAFPYIGKAIYYVFRRLEKDYLEGDWYGYHWTYKGGQSVLNKSRWRIKKGVFHRFAVKEAHQDGMNYGGYAEVERSQLVVKIHSGRNSETARFRITWPIPSNAHILRGIWLSFDHDSKIASAAQLLSRDELTDSDAIAKIKEAMRWEKDRPAMRVKE
jgi:hypothetical protein